MSTRFLRVVAAAFAATIPLLAHAQAAPASNILDVAIPPGANFDKAEFRFWTPAGSVPIRAILLLMPGSNGDGRPAATDTTWQAFATRNHLAIVAARLTDKPHDQNFIEEYVDVSKGSGQALLAAIDSFAVRSGHRELPTLPFLLWGMSAGGEFNYEFVAWKPERVIAFVVNKGNIYYTALAPRAARETPGLLFVGGKDLEFRTNTIIGLNAVNRRAGALWALTEEPGIGHAVGRSRDLAMMFYEDVLAQRLVPIRGGDAGTVTLKPVDPKSGFIGDLKAKTFQPMSAGPVPNYPTAWLPTERLAKAWQAVVSEKPFEP